MDVQKCFSPEEWARLNAMEAFCSGIPTDQLTPGGLRKLVDALRGTEYSIHTVWRDPVIRDRRPSNQPLIDLAESQRDAAEALAPFKGGDDGEA